MGTPFRCYWESRSIGRKWFVGKFCVCVWKVFSEFSFSDRKCCFWNIVLNCTFDFKGRMLGHLRGLAGPQMVGGTWSIPGSCRPQQYRQRVFQAVTIPAKSIPGRNNPEQRVFQALTIRAKIISGVANLAKRPSSLEVGVAGVLLLLRGVQKFLHGPFCARTFKGVLSKYTKKRHFNSSPRNPNTFT